jgi:hypothetical protein
MWVRKDHGFTSSKEKWEEAITTTHVANQGRLSKKDNTSLDYFFIQARAHNVSLEGG